MSVSGNLAAEARLVWLRSRLRVDGEVSVALAAADLGVSELTVRRDLQELEARGEARRVRGGALAAGPRPFPARHRTGGRAKARIAVKLAALLPSAGAVGFDASSTVGRVVSSLGSVRELMIVTNGPETFGALQGVAGVTPVLTGGSLDARTGSLVGPVACRSAAQILLGRFFTSCAALDPDVGPSEAALEEAEVKRALAAVAAEVVLAVDASKLGSRAVAVGVPWDDVDLLVTDLDPSDSRLDPYRHRVEIV